AAKELQPGAFLVKPAADRSLKSAIEVAVTNFQFALSAAKQRDVPPPEHLFIRRKGRFEKVLQTAILWVEADESYSIIHTRDRTFTVTQKLKAMEARLSHPNFVRVHRSYIVNIQHVDALEGNTLIIGKQLIPVSKSYQETLKRYLNLL
ncbi:MAG: response regulator transcription factor, partial [Bacteroidota bacterium]